VDGISVTRIAWAARENRRTEGSVGGVRPGHRPCRALAASRVAKRRVTRISSFRMTPILSCCTFLLAVGTSIVVGSCVDSATRPCSPEFTCGRDARGRDNERRLGVVRGGLPRKDTDAASDDDKARDREHVDERTGHIALVDG
jgi:hypothetical protein